MRTILLLTTIPVSEITPTPLILRFYLGKEFDAVSKLTVATVHRDQHNRGDNNDLYGVIDCDPKPGECNDRQICQLS